MLEVFPISIYGRNISNVESINCSNGYFPILSILVNILLENMSLNLLYKNNIPTIYVTPYVRNSIDGGHLCHPESSKILRRDIRSIPVKDKYINIESFFSVLRNIPSIYIGR
jgi:hypothetical protein